RRVVEVAGRGRCIGFLDSIDAKIEGDLGAAGTFANGKDHERLDGPAGVIGSTARVPTGGVEGRPGQEHLAIDLVELDAPTCVRVGVGVRLFDLDAQQVAVRIVELEFDAVVRWRSRAERRRASRGHAGALVEVPADAAQSFVGLGRLELPRDAERRAVDVAEVLRLDGASDHDREGEAMPVAALVVARWRRSSSAAAAPGPVAIHAARATRAATATGFAVAP